MMEYLAPAKINLGLWIHGKREDGFHELSTIFQEIPLYDKILISESVQTKFVCLDFPSQDNLCLKAWKLLESEQNCSLPAHIELNKKIPEKAGLGGASSDATHTLHALNQYHKLGLSDEDLIKVAAKLGSDTAFFVRGGCQAGEGRGEHLRPLSTQLQSFLLLAIPSFGCSTAEIFHNLKDRFSPRNNQVGELEGALEIGKLAEIEKKLTNDLTAPALEVVPQLKYFMDTCQRTFRKQFVLSGSGSSCFALFDTPCNKPATFEGRYLGLFDLAGKKIVWEMRS